MNPAIFQYYLEREEHTAALAEEAMVLEQELQAEDNIHYPTLVCWHNLRGDDSSSRTLSGFNCQDFMSLFEIVKDVMPVKIGRGRWTRFPPEDRLLMTLCYLKHYETIDKMKDAYRISGPHLSRILRETVGAIEPVLYQRFVLNHEAPIPDDDDVFPMARYVMDVTFQPIWTPIGTYNERKRWYSGKHKQYGLKSQVIHDRQ